MRAENKQFLKQSKEYNEYLISLFERTLNLIINIIGKDNYNECINIIKLKMVINVMIFKYPKNFIFFENIKNQINNGVFSYSVSIMELVRLINMITFLLIVLHH